MQSVDVDHLAAGGIDQVTALAHLLQAGAVNQPAGLRSIRHMQADHIRRFEHLLKAGKRRGIAQRQFGDDVMVDHAHA